MIATLLATALGSPGAEYLANLWQTEDGLPDGTVLAVAQTPDGYLWAGTRNGLARFDGRRFQTFDPRNTPELADAVIRHLFTDPRGTLWIALLDGGLVSWRQGIFRQEVPADPGLRVKRLVGLRGESVFFALLTGNLLCGSPGTNGVLAWQTIPLPDQEAARWFAAGGDGTILCASTNGRMFRLGGDKLNQLPNPGMSGTNFCGLAASSDGSLWAATGEEIAVWDGSRFQHRSAIPEGPAWYAAEIAPATPAAPGAVEARPQFYSSALFAGRDGWLWLRLGQRLLGYRDGVWLTNLPPSAIPLQEFANLSALCPDNQGGFWSFGRDLGLFHVSRDGSAEAITSTSKAMNAQRVEALFEDREGNLWLGLARLGLAQLRKPRFTLLGAAQGLASPVTTSVCEGPDGTLWVGTIGDGLGRWSGGSFSSFKRRDDVKSVLTGRQGGVWCATGSGLELFENGEFRHPFALASRRDISALMEDRPGRLWFGAEKQLVRWDGRADRWFGATEGFTNARALCFAQTPDGAIWMGTDTGELRCLRDGKFSVFRPENTGALPAIWALHANADGTIWAGTRGGGLLHFDQGRFLRVTTHEGLPHDVICSILDDGLGHLWFSSHGGIFRVAKTTLDAFVRGEISVVTCLACGKQDGLPTLECTGGFQPAACRGQDGRLWFATVMGVVSVQPEEIAVNQLPPSVVIESAAADGKPVSWAHADAKPTLRIGPGRFVLDIDYTGLSFTAPERVRFKHRLLGVDKDWYFAGDRRSVSYPYLPPGDYEFQVTACNNDGVWNETGASLALAVKPHLWQRKTFQAVAVATLVAGAAAWAFGYARLRARRRIAQLERERALDKERARVARDLHDDLGAGLTEIGLIGGLADEVAVPLEQAQDYLRQITARSREMVTSLDEIVWSVNPKHDSVAALGNYFCDYAQQLLQLLPLRCRMEVVEPLPAQPLNSEQRHNLLMAFKEALTNVIRHAHASEVRIRIAAGNGLLEIQVSDDGRGGAGAVGTSTADGLGNMARRLADIGGCCVVESESGRGTTVRFVLPLAPASQP